MLEQRADTDRDLLHLVCDNEVTAIDLAGHRRGAILAARDLGRPFVVATDLTTCVDVSTPAARELAETVRHLMPFGLGSDLRVISEKTPPHVLDAFENPRETVPVDVVRVNPGENVGATLDAHLARARC
jgi:hypothetical protein